MEGMYTLVLPQPPENLLGIHAHVVVNIIGAIEGNPEALGAVAAGAAEDGEPKQKKPRRGNEHHMHQTPVDVCFAADLLALLFTKKRDNQ